MAAGLIIARESGCMVEPLNQNGNILKDGDVIIANEAIFETFAKVIRKKPVV